MDGYKVLNINIKEGKDSIKEPVKLNEYSDVSGKTLMRAGIDYEYDE